MPSRRQNNEANGRLRGHIGKEVRDSRKPSESAAREGACAPRKRLRLMQRKKSASHRIESRGRERHRRPAYLGERAGANESNALQFQSVSEATMISTMRSVNAEIVRKGLTSSADRIIDPPSTYT